MSDWTPTRTFDAIALYEEACDAGHYERSLVGDRQNRPLGFAWAPVGLNPLPSFLGPKTVELSGPGGQTLLFVPLHAIGDAARAGGARRGWTDDDQRWRVLASLDPGEEPAVNGLFALLRDLVTT